MNWKDIRTSEDGTQFLYEGKVIFDKSFIEVLKFHSPGIAPVKDISGSYHIRIDGSQLYSTRYSRTFGFYCNRAAVIDVDKWFHITEHGDEAYLERFDWAGNFQENKCTVRKNDYYFHIDLTGKKIYNSEFVYAGDFKDGIACVKTCAGYFKHIDERGNDINAKSFQDLGVFHKHFATAKDEIGWHHIDKSGMGLYKERYMAIEPFYNGFALVTCFDSRKKVIDERGRVVLEV